jgi:Ca2+-binding RTX toxin-like protein
MGEFMRGGTGNDTLAGGEGNDITNGGDGNDNLDGGIGNDLIQGEAGNDFLTAKDGRDTMDGGAGADTLEGSVGAESLVGGADSDRIRGDTGADTMTGGTGVDIFIYGSVVQSGTAAGTQDRITDFTAGVGGDVIDLSGIDADGVAGLPNGVFAFLGTGGFSGAAGVRAFFNGVDTEIQVDTGDAGTAPDMIILLNGNLAASLVASNFVL